MSRYSTLPRTLCFVFHKDQVLLIKGGESKDWAGIYNALGGHIEKHEDVIDAANREIEEESGLTPNDTKLRGVIHATDFYGVDVMMFVTESRVDTKEVVPNHEGELEWVDIDKVEEYPVFEDVKPILDKVMESKGVFSGVSRFDGQGKLVKLVI